MKWWHWIGFAGWLVLAAKCLAAAFGFTQIGSVDLVFCAIAIGISAGFIVFVKN